MDTVKGSNALTQPTRAQLFQTICDLKRPAATDELAQLLGRHPNGIRQHLEHLREAGLLIREQSRQGRGRGRPRDLWAVDPAAAPGGVKPTAYAELGVWLARVIEGGVDPKEVEHEGHQIGLDLAPDATDEVTPEARFQDALSAMGFQPSRVSKQSGSTTYCLNNCPYRDVVRAQQPMICALHRGITTGLLESIDESVEMSGFEIKDPDRAGCKITVLGNLAGMPASE